ncbi:MAG: thioredoxin reductase [Saprospiraceae bacterium]|jgi:thioredoxin reductase
MVARLIFVVILCSMASLLIALPVFVSISILPLRAVYSRPDFEQQCKIPQTLGCELTEQGLIEVNMFQKINLGNVFCCGDNSSPLRAVSSAVAAGNIAGAMANNEMTEEEF